MPDIYKAMREALKQARIETPDLEARLILKHVLKVSDAALIAGEAISANPQQAEQIRTIVARRVANEPLSRIFGEREFYGLTFHVTPDVLDPRPDTETIIDAVCDSGVAPIRILDLGTGSGALIVTLLHLFPQAQGVAVDISEAALSIAKKNAARNGVDSRVKFVRGSWLDSLNEDESFDLIVSNPPYIPSNDIPNLESSVKNHDPILALDGGKDGFDAYNVIITKIKKRLHDNGKALFEVGIGQASYVVRLAENNGFAHTRIYQDLSGVPRAVEISMGKK